VRYTHGHAADTLAAHAVRRASDSAAYLLPHLEPGMALLDVGCGPGTITLDLAEAVDPGRVVGLENVEAPLVAARAKAAERGDTTTTWQLGDVRALPFDDDTFDVVHAHQVLQHLGDPVAALREMARVCRPGGLVAARDADYAAMAWHPEVPELDEWRAAYRTLARRNGAEPDAGRRMRAWARAAGLTDAVFSASAWSYTDAEATAWWGETWAGRVREPRFREQAAEIGLGDHDLARIAQGWRRWGADPDAWFTITHGELLARLPG